MYPSYFFFNDTATTEIYSLSLHNALPIYANLGGAVVHAVTASIKAGALPSLATTAGRFRMRTTLPSPKMDAPLTNSVDRKSTRLNSSHLVISYAVFCLKRKTSAEAAGVTA